MGGPQALPQALPPLNFQLNFTLVFTPILQIIQQGRPQTLLIPAHSVLSLLVLIPEYAYLL